MVLHFINSDHIYNFRNSHLDNMENHVVYLYAFSAWVNCCLVHMVVVIVALMVPSSSEEIE
jgi:protein tyrosine phosphatase